MNGKCPCVSCIVSACCSKHCNAYVDYFSRLIRAYARHGTKSRLYKASMTQISLRLRVKLMRCIDGFWNIKMANKNSGHYVVYNRTGRIIERG